MEDAVLPTNQAAVKMYEHCDPLVDRQKLNNHHHQNDRLVSIRGSQLDERRIYPFALHVARLALQAHLQGAHIFSPTFRCHIGALSASTQQSAKALL